MKELLTSEALLEIPPLIPENKIIINAGKSNFESSY